MGDDVKILAVAAASASVAVGGGLLVARSISTAVDRLRDTSRALAAGDLSARAREGGPAELAELASSFNAMADELSRLFDARRELVAWASHDLRTPIASLQAMIEAIEDGLAEPEHYLPALRQQVRTLATLVDDLFELARIDAGALTLELRERDVAGLVDECVRGFEAEAASRRVRLEARTGPETRARCEPEKVQRILFNLVTNALRHTPSDGSIAVLVEPRDEEVQVTVEDTGEGLDAEVAPDVRALLAQRPARAGDGAGSASRSRAGSSRRTAAASGRSAGRAEALGFRSRCRPRKTACRGSSWR